MNIAGNIKRILKAQKIEWEELVNRLELRDDFDVIHKKFWLRRILRRKRWNTKRPKINPAYIKILAECLNVETGELLK